MMNERRSNKTNVGSYAQLGVESTLGVGQRATNHVRQQ